MISRRALAVAGTCAIALGLGPVLDGATPRRPRPPGVRVADMGMGSWGPQLGGDSDDMVLDDPGQDIGTSPGIVSMPGQYISDSPGFLNDPGQDIGNSPGDVSNPGYIPAQPQMDIQPQQDLDRDDYLD
ncbi:MAG: hypothetical protein ACKOCT_09535 [Alphaproteobacteria bacterium]